VQDINYDINYSQKGLLLFMKFVMFSENANLDFTKKKNSANIFVKLWADDLKKSSDIDPRRLKKIFESLLLAVIPKT